MAQINGNLRHFCINVNHYSCLQLSDGLANRVQTFPWVTSYCDHWRESQAVRASVLGTIHQCYIGSRNNWTKGHYMILASTYKVHYTWRASGAELGCFVVDLRLYYPGELVQSCKQLCILCPSDPWHLPGELWYPLSKTVFFCKYFFTNFWH